MSVSGLPNKTIGPKNLFQNIDKWSENKVNKIKLFLQNGYSYNCLVQTVFSRALQQNWLVAKNIRRLVKPETKAIIRNCDLSDQVFEHN